MPAARKRRDALAKRGANWDDRTPPPSVDLRELDAALYRKIAEAENPMTVEGQQVRVGGFIFSAKGLEVDLPPTQEEWQQAGEILFKLEGSIQWLIGDWLVYGESVQWGEIPAIAATLGRDVQTLYNYASVCRSVEISLRKEILSYNHHALVSALSPEQQEQALAYAAEHNLSVAAFRKWLKGEDALPEPTGTNIEEVVAQQGKLIKKLMRLLELPKLSTRHQLEATVLLRNLREWLDEQEAKLKQS